MRYVRNRIALKISPDRSGLVSSRLRALIPDLFVQPRSLSTALPSRRNRTDNLVKFRLNLTKEGRYGIVDSSVSYHYDLYYCSGGADRPLVPILLDEADCSSALGSYGRPKNLSNIKHLTPSAFLLATFDRFPYKPAACEHE